MVQVQINAVACKDFQQKDGCHNCSDKLILQKMERHMEELMTHWIEKTHMVEHQDTSKREHQNQHKEWRMYNPEEPVEAWQQISRKKLKNILHVNDKIAETKKYLTRIVNMPESAK